MYSSLNNKCISLEDIDLDKAISLKKCLTKRVQLPQNVLNTSFKTLTVFSSQIVSVKLKLSSPLIHLNSTFLFQYFQKKSKLRNPNFMLEKLFV